MARRGEENEHDRTSWVFSFCFLFVFFFFLRFTRSAAVGFDYCRFWVMVFPVMGFGVAGVLKLMGFG